MDGSNVGGGSGSGDDNVTDIKAGRRRVSSFPEETTSDIAFEQARKEQFAAAEAKLAFEMRAANDETPKRRVVPPVAAEVHGSIPHVEEAHDLPQAHTVEPEAHDPGNTWPDAGIPSSAAPASSTTGVSDNAFAEIMDGPKIDAVHTADAEALNSGATSTPEPVLASEGVEAPASSDAPKANLPEDDDEFLGKLRMVDAAINQSSERAKGEEQIKLEHLQRELDALNGGAPADPNADPKAQQNRQRVSALSSLMSSLSRRGNENRQLDLQKQILAAQHSLGMQASRDAILRTRLEAMHGARQALRSNVAEAVRKVEAVNQALLSTPQGAQHHKEMQNVAGMLGTTPEGLRARMANPSDPDPFVQALRKRGEQLREDPALASLSAQSIKANAEYERALEHAGSMKDGADFLSRNGVDVSSLRDMHRTVEKDMEAMDGMHAPLLDPAKADFSKRNAAMAEEMRKAVEAMIKRMMELLEKMLGGGRRLSLGALAPGSSQMRVNMAGPAPSPSSRPMT